MSRKKTSGGFSFAIASLAIAICIGIGIFVYTMILGNPNNFDAEGHPKPGNILGIMYKGGFIVPILIGVLLTVITFAIERFITIQKAMGKVPTEKFIEKIKKLLSEHQYEQILEECDKQGGSLANVIHEGVSKMIYVKNDNRMDKEAKVAAIQKAIEEAIALELPMLSKNMVVISTCASIGVLVGLIGTVFGMIRAFAALATSGAPDTSALATGISEALVNTAIGIMSSTFAIIFYNLFNNRIDQLTYAMDEAGFTIIQEFQSTEAAVNA
jgi:biopolymer transport protein ExbB